MQSTLERKVNEFTAIQPRSAALRRRARKRMRESRRALELPYRLVRDGWWLCESGPHRRR